MRDLRSTGRDSEDVSIRINVAGRVKFVTSSSAPDPEIRSIHDAYNALSAVKRYLQRFEPLHDDDATSAEVLRTSHGLGQIDTSLNKSLVYLMDIIEG